jgi:ABC-type multidrug transport system fused ATPase/permease subunit
VWLHADWQKSTMSRVSTGGALASNYPDDEAEEAKRECSDDNDDGDETNAMTTISSSKKKYGHHHHHRGSVLRRDVSRNNYLSHLVRRQDRFLDAAMESLRAESDRVRAGQQQKPQEEEELRLQAAVVRKDEEEAKVEGVEVGALLGREEEGVEMVEPGVEASIESVSLVDEADAKAMSTKLEEISALLSGYGVDLSSPAHRNTPIETRIESFSYVVPVDDGAVKIRTVYNSSALYHVVRLVKRLWAGEPVFHRSSGAAAATNAKWKAVLDRIDLIIEPGKAYLLLGSPGSGRSTLLKAIAGLLRPGRKDRIEGSISYNGRTLAVRDWLSD